MQTPRKASSEESQEVSVVERYHHEAEQEMWEGDNKKEFWEDDIISPKVCTAYWDGVIKKVKWKDLSIKTDGDDLSELTSADYAVLVGKSWDDLKQVISDLHNL